MKLVGLTGGIATGKSTVASLFKELGALVINADLIAREVLEPGAEAYSDVVQEFGPGILNPDSTINRPALASLIFREPWARLRLNQITHPRIRDRALKRAEEHFKKGARVVIVEAALIGESEHDPPFDAIILVTADIPKQMERLMSHWGMSREEAELRIAAQMPQEKKRAIATHIIDNNGTIEETRRQVEKVWRELSVESPDL